MENPFVIGLFLLAIAVIIVFLYKKTAIFKSKGDKGEFVVAKTLGDTINGHQYVINDLIFADKAGHTCQIDHILINQYGIWVIETKNYSGRIYGNENDLNWTQVLAYGNEKNQFYNPIKQNTTHIFRLSEYLMVNNIFHNVVVFLPDADISRVKATNVYSVRYLKRVINNKTGIELSVVEMESYYNKLISLKTNSKVTKQEHIQNIQMQQNNINHNICPRCGSKLVLRNGSNGQFYGCSNYPKCKFTKKKD